MTEMDAVHKRFFTCCLLDFCCSAWLRLGRESELRMMRITKFAILFSHESCFPALSGRIIRNIDKAKEQSPEYDH